MVEGAATVGFGEVLEASVGSNCVVGEPIDELVAGTRLMVADATSAESVPG